MFFLNFLPLLFQLSFLWICHLWYLLFLLLLLCLLFIYGISVVSLIICTIVGTTYGFTLAFIIFCALIYVLSYSFFTLEPKAPPSSTLFFLLKALLGKSVIFFFLFSNDVYISSLVLLTMVGSLCGFSFWCTNRYWKIIANTNVN